METTGRPLEVIRPFAPEEPVSLLADAVEQWLDWEEQANLIGFRTSTGAVSVEVASVPRERVTVTTAVGAPEAITARYMRGDQVLFPRHPLNTDASVAFFSEPALEHWTCRFTSSRTLVAIPAGGERLHSLKLPTDHPHPHFRQPEKTKLRRECEDALSWVALLERVDDLLGPTQDLVIVREVLSVLVPGSDNGYLVRDLGSFQDGSYYLPALSIPFVGRQIARALGEAFELFWGRYYAEAAGRAKATLFARTGLLFDTPNPQNLLVQLDGRLRPTGRIVIRDLGDAYCATDSTQQGEVPWTRLTEPIEPQTPNSFWAFSEAGDHRIDETTLEDWYARHDRAYLAVLAAYFPALAPPPEAEPSAAFAHWNAALLRTEGGDAVEAAFQQRLRAPRAAPS